MKLSVIIINYNVKYFLEQCLFSVYKSLSGIEGEIIVVDNSSVDGSEMMIRSGFPDVKLITNQTNVGFSKANNQALSVAKGEYVLLLNPDTVLEESTLSQCIAFMDAHQHTGALGPKMIDGKGRFLPESKRGLPTPEVAFYKIFGLARLFPKSKMFGKYYLGYTSPDEIQEIQVLTGAFMFIRRSVLEITGFLDEKFFMYGEDIDLSYRISQAGYKLVYFPKTTIIHYKGESTKKGSLNYVLIFYRAMQIFANKTFKDASFYSFCISIAIYFRAALSVLSRGFRVGIPLLLDATTTYFGCYALARGWATLYFHNPAYYPEDLLRLSLLLLAIIIVLANIITGGYRKPYNLIRVIKGILYGAAFVSIVYAFLPLQFRISRVLLLAGTAWAMVGHIVVRILLRATGNKEYQLDTKTKRRFAIVGFQEESARVQEILKMAGVVTQSIVRVNPGNAIVDGFFTGNILQLREIINIYNINEVIFCAKDVSSEVIIDLMKSLGDTHVDFKIAPPGSSSVIGSNSSNTSGDLYVIKVNSIRMK